MGVRRIAVLFSDNQGVSRTFAFAGRRMQLPFALPARGSRFAGDAASICLYIGRSTNGNLVVYDAPVDPASGAFVNNPPIDGS